MTRRLLLSGGGVAGVVPTDPPPPTIPPGTDPLDTSPGTLPYAFPTSAPYNVPTYAITPTPDASGSAVHPDVVDFGPGVTWNGWRFWMGVTPYKDSDASQENPVILVSADGYTWRSVSGATPVALFSTIHGGHQSDTDLVYDVTGNRLILTWREYIETDPATEWIYGAQSTDGVTWSARTDLWNVSTAGSTFAGNNASQAVVRVGATDWRSWARNAPSGTNGGLAYRTATNPLGTWSAPTQCTLTPAVGSSDTRFWHFDAIRYAGKFYGLFNFDGYTRAGTSTDGLSWTIKPTNLIISRSGEWDDRDTYRSTMQPHVNGTHMRVWYSTNSNTVTWRVAYTKVPLSAWD